MNMFFWPEAALPVSELANMLEEPDTSGRQLAVAALRHIGRVTPLAPDLAAKIDLFAKSSCH